MNTVFCNRPFKQVMNLIGEEYAPCCWINKDKSLDPALYPTPHEILPIEMFDGELFSGLRKDMLLGEKTEFLKSHCGKCWDREEKTGFGPRLIFQDFPLELREMFNDDGTYKSGNYRHLRLGLNIFGNYCNLECYECIPTNSSSRMVASKKLDDKWTKIKGGPLWSPNGLHQNSDVKKVDSEWFSKIVSNILDHAHNIQELSFCGGEPALMRSHFEILDALVLSGHSKHIILNYTSNMTIMNLSVLKKYIDQFKCVLIQWSVDGLKAENSWLRYPTDWDKMMVNVREVKKYLEQNNKGILRATMTPSLFGIMGFTKLCRWLYLGGFIPSMIDIDVVNNITFKSILHQRHLPNELKEQISGEIEKLSPSLHKALWMDRDEEKFQLALEYATDLDNSRGTNWKEVFPELVPYLK